MKLVRLEPAAPRSQIKHSTTEPLRSLVSGVTQKYMVSQYKMGESQDSLMVEQDEAQQVLPHKSTHAKYFRIKIVIIFLAIRFNIS